MAAAAGLRLPSRNAQRVFDCASICEVDTALQCDIDVSENALQRCNAMQCDIDVS